MDETDETMLRRLEVKEEANVLPDGYQFFKILLPGTFTHNLRLPPKLAAQIAGEDLGRAAVLRGPGGDLWGVSIEGSGEHLCLGDGWGDFARAHHLQVGFMLLFRHQGGMLFSVAVFDHTACQKDYPPAGSGSASGELSESPDDLPSEFVTKLQPCNLEGKPYLNIPIAFLEKHRYLEEGAVTLERQGRSWPVRLYHSLRRDRIGRRTRLGGGWHQFCRDNGLEAGDMCFFRAIPGGRPSVLVVKVLKKGCRNIA